MELRRHRTDKHHPLDRVGGVPDTPNLMLLAALSLHWLRASASIERT
jgi:hypothetical protein